mmetsp:Transcript_35194/g.110804  ORF Transcript_35194/g.110804 Transcript_35194/m.110804 type:complete len:204 (-) Transcript_35194:2176-2787(-)
MATHLCTPSRLTWSMTNSSPSRYSCTSTPMLRWPRPLIFPLTERKASCTSSVLLQRKTSSVPADSMGLTMTLKGDGFHSRKKSAMGPHSSARSCFTARTPEARTVSPMKYLLRRCSDSSMPLLRVPRRTARRSARSTPVSAPGSTATTGSSMAMSCATVCSRAASWSSTVLSCCTVGASPNSLSPTTSSATGESFSASTMTRR